MPTTQQRQANAQFFTNLFSMLNEGGFYVWPDKGHIYTNENGEMTVNTEQGFKDIRSITPRGWARQNIKLKRD